MVLALRALLPTDDDDSCCDMSTDAAVLMLDHDCTALDLLQYYAIDDVFPVTVIYCTCSSVASISSSASNARIK